MTLNNNLTTPTNAQALVDAINNDPTAAILVQARVRSGLEAESVAGTSIGSLGRTASFDADPLSHFRNRKKMLAWLAARAV